VGVIGAGGNANGHMRSLINLKDQDNVEIIAVCDLYQPRLDKAAELTGGKPFHDYRKLLDLKGLDYVVVSVPEHWHAPITMDALDQGLHVYCEKPLTYNIEQGLAVRKKVKETGLKLQCGIQGMSDDSYETAAKYIEEGAIGKPVMAQIDYSRNEKVGLWDRPPDPEAQPGVNLDWKTFLGSAPQREWDPDRFFAWRRYWDYSGGIATDLFVHRIARIIKACKLTTPERVVATGGKNFFTDSVAEVPDTFNVMLEYPGGMTVMLVSTLANEARIRHMIRGRKATLEFTREGFEIIPERLFADEVKPATHTKTGDEDMELHHHNLHNAIRQGAELKCDVDMGFYASMACQMAVESFRTRKYLSWDAKAEKVVEA
jgi:predicted dehydrogenase